MKRRLDIVKIVVLTAMFASFVFFDFQVRGWRRDLLKTQAVYEEMKRSLRETHAIQEELDRRQREIMRAQAGCQVRGTL